MALSSSFPDGRRLRLYSRATHGPELPAMFDNPWLFPRPLAVASAGSEGP